jgi:uncharacterized protein (DUF1800 family)
MAWLSIHPFAADPGRARRRRVLTRAAVGVAALAGLPGCSTAPGAQGSPTLHPDRRQAASSLRPAESSRLPGTSAALTGAPDDALALHLLNRLAWGPTQPDRDRLSALGVRRWIEAQLEPSSIELPAVLQGELDSLGSIHGPHAPTLARFAALQAEVLGARTEAGRREAARIELGSLIRTVQTEARRARILRAVHSPRQLEEVLVDVWFNHFNVFAGKETVRVTAGFFESEAIRPHVLGRFRDLLGATARHPAMLNYLDNWQSVAAGFRIPPGTRLPDGFVSPRGLNENYARELLELHTLGAQGGYEQDDVVELARILTGWSFDRRTPGPRDAFRFFPPRHDQGPKRLLGQRVPGQGQQQGEWALDLLARHPSTARHVSTRLARAFVSDDPPQTLVARLAEVYQSTDGDLRELMRALVFSDEFLSPAVFGAKFKSPMHHVISAARACSPHRLDALRLVREVARMGMPIHLCPTPDGWQDTRQTWLNAEGLRQRVEFGRTLAAAAQALVPAPLALALSPPTRRVLAELPRSEQLSVALASPDFMRR